MIPPRLHRLSVLAVILWLLHCGVLVVLAAATEVDTIARATDVAREKDVVWLSLATALAAIGFSAWLVRQLLAQQGEAIKALNGLREELAQRPCVIAHRLPPP